MSFEPPGSNSPRHKLSWCLPTPTKYLALVLLAQGILVASAFFGWFDFNREKGHAVLITCALTSLLLLLLVIWLLASRFFKAKAQFSLATLLLMVPVAAIPFRWLAHELSQASQQRLAVESIRKQGGRVLYRKRDPSRTFTSVDGADWLRELLGRDFFDDVLEVVSRRADDTEAERLKGLTHLKALDLSEAPMTDAGLAYFARLTELEYLDLSETVITDQGVEHLKGLTSLRELYLRGTNITDVGLEHLQGLTQLQRINLEETKVTRKGATKFRIGMPNMTSIKASVWVLIPGTDPAK